jgi:hypothetical protein
MKTRIDQPADRVAPADALNEFGKLRETLTLSHVEIPKLLAAERSLVYELGLAEARGDSNVAQLRSQVEETLRSRHAAVRRRTSALTALLELEPALQHDRAAVEAERLRIAGGIAAEFAARWQAACDRLAGLRLEAASLSAALRITVETRPPYQAFIHPIRETAELRPLAASGPPPEAVLPANLTALIARLDGLDGALGRIQAVRQSKQLDARHYDLSRVRGQPSEFPGTFEVTGEFDSLVDGMKFAVGTLVDASLLGPGQLSRLTASRRYLRPADLAATAA